MMEFFGSILKTSSKILGRSVPANTIKTTFQLLYLQLFLKIFILINSEFKGVFLSTSNRTEGYITVVQQDHRKFTKAY